MRAVTVLAAVATAIAAGSTPAAANGGGPGTAEHVLGFSASAFPSPAVAGNTVTLSVFVQVDEDTTITSLQSTRLGNLADAANAALISTTCSLPATISVATGGAFSCLTTFVATGPPGDQIDTVSMGLTQASTGAVTRQTAYTLTIDNTFGTIEGLVTNPDGTPAAGVGVNAVGPVAGQFPSTSTGADGRYQLGGVVPGDLTVAADSFDPTGNELKASAPVTVAAGQTVTVDLQLQPIAPEPPGGTLQGVVTLARTGAPQSNVGVQVTSGTFTFGATTGPDGSYSISGMPAGDYLVCAGALDPATGGFVSRQLVTCLPAFATVADGQTTIANIVLGRSSSGTLPSVGSSTRPQLELAGGLVGIGLLACAGARSGRRKAPVPG